jgi:hypothetical protein
MVLPLLAAALVFPAAAAAKGPDRASISGPGLGKTLVLKGNGEWENSRLGQLTMLAGFFPAAYGQSPNPMLSSAPTKDLGPKYTVRYRVPGGEGTRYWIRADFYPYAKGGALTYTKPGQRVFDMHTRGGWFLGGTQLRLTLRHAGLPARAPEGGGSNAALVAGLAVPGALALGIVLFVTRRRLRPARP